LVFLNQVICACNSAGKWQLGRDLKLCPVFQDWCISLNERNRQMSHEQPIEVEGTISTVLPGTMFRVKLDNMDQHEILAHLSGKMRKHFVRLTVGDRVRLEMSPYDLSKGRITYRLR